MLCEVLPELSTALMPLPCNVYITMTEAVRRNCLIVVKESRTRVKAKGVRFEHKLRHYFRPLVARPIWLNE